MTDYYYHENGEMIGDSDNYGEFMYNVGAKQTIKRIRDWTKGKKVDKDKLRSYLKNLRKKLK